MPVFVIIMRTRVFGLLASGLTAISLIWAGFPKSGAPEVVPMGLKKEDLCQISSLVCGAEWHRIIFVQSWNDFLNLPCNLWYSRNWRIATPPNLLTNTSILSPQEFPVIIAASDGNKTVRYAAKYWVRKEGARWKVSRFSRLVP